MQSRSNASLTQTNWDLIRDASSGSPTAAKSLDAVARRSWPAIYAFIRASGRNGQDAAELTQGFLCDVFLSRHLLEKADPGRGRFRTLLIGAVRNYLADMHRRKTAARRMPVDGIAALDQMREHGHEPAVESSPERAFHARYVGTLIRDAAERLQRELLAENDEASWEIFRARVLEGVAGANHGYEPIAERFGITRGECAARLLVTKRRFAAMLMDEIRATIESPDDLRTEIQELLELLRQS
ncbi:MAG: RNA polymerase sigma factor [Planctomycetota bacterium]